MQAAIVSGVAIIIMAIAAFIANDATIQRLVVQDNAIETLNNILASKLTFNIGVLSWLVILIFDLIVAWGLYLFFKKINKSLALIAASFRLIYVAMLAVSIQNLVYVNLITNQLEPSSVYSAEQMAKTTMFYLNAFDAMWAVSLIVFGIHILLVGYLALKSEYIPKIFGILLIIAFLGYTFPKMSNLLFPQYTDIMRTIEAIFLIPMLSEAALGIWFLIIGFRNKIQNK